MAVMTLSTIMYTNLGLTNTELALYTSWLYLPWVIKPIWVSRPEDPVAKAPLLFMQ